MINIEVQYFSLCRNLLLAVGLWPYQKQSLAQFQYIFLSAILITAVIFHLTSFITEKVTLIFTIEVFSVIIITIAYAIKYNAFWVNSETVRFMLEQLQHMCDELKDSNELAIMIKYGTDARRYTIGITASVVCGAITFILIQSWTSILSVVLPRNESRPHHLLFRMEYFFDQQKYFYITLLHINACIGVMALIGPAIATVLIASLKCICGMFAVASYRIEHAFTIDMLQNVNANNKNLIHEGIFGAVDIHRKAVKYSEHVVSKFMTMLLLLIMSGVICLSLNLFRVFYAMSLGYNIGQLLLPLIIVCFIFSYMFLISYIGQNIIDHNSQIFTTVYNVQWYKAPLHVQKLIQFLLQKGTKDFTLKMAGGLFSASLECFATLMNASMSYFTLIYAMQS